LLNLGRCDPLGRGARSAIGLSAPDRRPTPPLPFVVTAQSSIPPSQLKRTLWWSVADGVLHAVMLGLSESYMGALAVELGHQDTALALLATVPPLLGALSQLLSPWLVLRLGSRKRLVVLGALTQGLSHLALIALAVFEIRGLFWFILAKVAFWVAGMVIAPPWNAWFGSLTDRVDRGRYLLGRTLACHLALLMSFLWAGWYLQAGRPKRVLVHYAVLFTWALVARSISALTLALHADPDPPMSGTVPVKGRLLRALSGGPWKLAIAIGLLQLGAHVSVPFFTPYMLRTLRMELDTFAQLTSITIVTKALCLPVWSLVTRRFGLAAAMSMSVAGVAVVPAAWVWATTMPDLIWVHVLGGLTWSGFEYVSFQLLLGGTPKHISVEFFSLSSALAGVMQLVGSLVGSLILRGGADYHAVFLLSSVLRAVPLLLLTPVAAKLGRGLKLRRMWMRLVSVRPGSGVERRPMVDTAPDDEDPPV